MPANSPIPFPDSRTEAQSIPAGDQGAVISNSQSDSPERILRAESGQDKDPLLTAQVAWSQNLGHAKVLTTFLSYGEVACQRQGENIQGFATPPQAVQSEVNEIAKAVVKENCATVAWTHRFNELHLKSDSQMNTIPQSGWLTASEAAAYLKVKPRSLLLWVRQGKLQAFALSGTKRRIWRFRKEDLDSALLASPVIPSKAPTVLSERRTN